jgi:hypothetical protein
LITKTLADTILEAKRGSKKQQKEVPAEKPVQRKFRREVK